MKEYFRYIAHLFENVPPLSEQEVIERDYRDKVQAPLQPLADNESANVTKSSRRTIQNTTLTKMPSS